MAAEHTLFVWAAFGITFLVLGLHCVLVVREGRHAKKALFKKFSMQSTQTLDKFSESNYFILSTINEKNLFNGRNPLIPLVRPPFENGVNGYK